MVKNTRLVQLNNLKSGRRIAVVEEPLLVLLKEITSIYDLALKVLAEGKTFMDLIKLLRSGETLDYNAVYEETSDWKFLPAYDHPDNPFACLVSGTGLTHKNSALSRQSMHQMRNNEVTDSIRMYQWGEEGGWPEEDEIGIQPEWFYKGNGTILRAHGDLLKVPPYGDDGGEEPEIAAAYIVDADGHPRRIGFCTGNEFSDHVMEKKNYLYLAPSKLRTCSIGPELVLGMDFLDVKGTVRVLRKGKTLWSKAIQTGQKNMAHHLQNLEHHHFKYKEHRIPFQAHVHFLGADAFSFGENIKLESKDVAEVKWDGMGRALRNTIAVSEEIEKLVKVRSIQ